VAGIGYSAWTLCYPKLTVTAEGRYLIRNVAMALDRYLPPQMTGFSKAI
jgi:hypothetical protein